MKHRDLDLARKLVWLRNAQIVINEKNQVEHFKVPIHLALGHEAIAVAVDATMNPEDGLFVTHRNVHYNLARQGSLKEELDEYYLKTEGIAKGRLGSMNLYNHNKGVMYASSILANDLPVACGFALGNKQNGEDAVTFVITGDGAIEEGAFYESLLFMKSFNLKQIVIIEDNDWSLATRIEERRSEINIEQLVSSFGIQYTKLESNDIYEYTKRLSEIRNQVVENKSPMVVEVKLTTLGHWYLFNEDHPHGKFINYHSGLAKDLKDLEKMDYPIIEEGISDPLYVLKKHHREEQLIEISIQMIKKLREDLG